eukprot:272227-Pleurochrysis_carterae.AAC.2
MTTATGSELRSTNAPAGRLARLENHKDYTALTTPLLVEAWLLDVHGCSVRCAAGSKKIHLHELLWR